MTADWRQNWAAVILNFTDFKKDKNQNFELEFEIWERDTTEIIHR
jgi:hypothetical protein